MLLQSAGEVTNLWGQRPVSAGDMFGLEPLDFSAYRSEAVSSATDTCPTQAQHKRNVQEAAPTKETSKTRREGIGPAHASASNPANYAGDGDEVAEAKEGRVGAEEDVDEDAGPPGATGRSMSTCNRAGVNNRRAGKAEGPRTARGPAADEPPAAGGPALVPPMAAVPTARGAAATKGQASSMPPTSSCTASGSTGAS